MRAFLPVGMYTQWYWKVDLRNLFNFLGQRLDPHAQREIREYAAEIFEMIRPVFPHSVEAFETHTLDSMRLSSRDIAAMRDGADTFRSARERREFEAKKRRLTRDD